MYLYGKGLIVMSYTENNYLNVNSEQVASNGDVSDKYNKFALGFAALMGVIGSAAVGARGGVDIDGIYGMCSLAFPQLTAWLISYMMYQNPSLKISNSQLSQIPQLSEKIYDSGNL